MKKMTRLTTLFSLLILLVMTACNPPGAATTGDNGKAEDCIDTKMVNLAKECADDYAPVCGCDKKTYKNECDAKRNGVQITTANACLDCLDPGKKMRRPCPKMLAPVCGCDGATYSNPCEAENAGVQKYSKGKCAGNMDKTCVDPSLRQPDGICPMNYAPVCGCNDQTYSNACAAERDGVKKWTKGACGKAVNNEDCIDPSKQSLRPCPDDYSPVCGCDGKTYSNACSAEVKGLTSWTKGACTTKAPDGCIDESKMSNRGCPENWEPVCGCDGKTYGNECEAKAKGVTTWAKGECGKSSNKTGCIDESKINPEGLCPMNYDPVCGCNNVTYSNECKAIIAGVTKWEKGACGK